MLSLSRLSAIKRQHVAVEAVRLAAEPLRSGGLTLVIAGEGATPRRVEAQAREAAVGDLIHFAGQVETHRKAAWLKHARAGLSCSSHEGAPSAVVEQLAFGVPVWLSDIEPHAELSDVAAAAGCPAAVTLHPLDDAATLARQLGELATGRSVPAPAPEAVVAAIDRFDRSAMLDAYDHSLRAAAAGLARGAKRPPPATPGTVVPRMRRSFWKSCVVFWRFKRQLVVLTLGGMVSAASFGAGLGMLYPVGRLLLNPEVSLGEQLRAMTEAGGAGGAGGATGATGAGEAAGATGATGAAQGPGVADAAAGKLSGLQDAARTGADGLVRTLVDALPADPFWQFVTILGVVVLLTAVGSVGRYFQASGAQTLTIYAEQWWREKLFRRAIRVPLDQLHADAGAPAASAELPSLKERMASKEYLRKARKERKNRQQAGFPLEADGPSGGTSDLIAHLTSDVSQMCLGYPVLLSRALEAILKGVVTLSLAFWLNWRLAAMACLAAPVIGFVIATFGRRIRKATRSELAFRGSLLLTLTQAFGGLATVKTHNAEGVERRRFHHVQRKILDERLRVRKIKALSSPLMDTLSLVAVVSVAAVAAWWVFRGGVDPIELVAVLGLLVAAGSSLKPLSTLNNDLQAAAAGADRVMALHHHLPAEPTDFASRRDLPPRRPVPRASASRAWSTATAGPTATPSMA